MIVLQLNNMLTWGPPPVVGPTIQPAPTPTADLNQLDRGIQFQQTPTYCGPTVGWLNLPVIPARFASGNFAVRAADATLLIDFGGEVTLPDVTAWVNEPHYVPFDPFSRGLWIKDLGGFAGSINITLTPFAGQTIDGQSSFVMNENHQITRLYPLIELTGWYVG